MKTSNKKTNPRGNELEFRFPYTNLAKYIKNFFISFIFLLLLFKHRQCNNYPSHTSIFQIITHIYIFLLFCKGTFFFYIKQYFSYLFQFIMGNFKNALQARCWILSEKEFDRDCPNVADRCFRTTICQYLFNTIVFRLFYLNNLCFKCFYKCKDTTFFSDILQGNHSPA